MTRSVPIFRKGKWISYILPEPLDPMWSPSHCLHAAAFYANALSRGYEPNESASLTVAYMNKQIYKGLQYHRSLEQKIAAITHLEETT
jgi:hypothetical protein